MIFTEHAQNYTAKHRPLQVFKISSGNAEWKIVLKSLHDHNMELQ